MNGCADEVKVQAGVVHREFSFWADHCMCTDSTWSLRPGLHLLLSVILGKLLTSTFSCSDFFFFKLVKSIFFLHVSFYFLNDFYFFHCRWFTVFCQFSTVQQSA